MPLGRTSTPAEHPLPFREHALLLRLLRLLLLLPPPPPPPPLLLLLLPFLLLLLLLRLLLLLLQCLLFRHETVWDLGWSVRERSV